MGREHAGSPFSLVIVTLALGAFGYGAGDTCLSHQSDPVSGAFSSSRFAVLENKALKCQIDTNRLSPNFGAVVSFIDKENLSAPTAGNLWFRLRTGHDSAAVQKVVGRGRDTIAVQIGPFGNLPLRAVLLYHLQSRSLVLSAQFIATGACVLDSGVAFDVAVPYKSLETSNPRSKPRRFRLASGIRREIHHDNLLRFWSDSSSLTFLVRNPFHSYLRTSVAADTHRIDVVPVIRNIGSGTENLPPITTALHPGDTLHRRFEVYGSGGAANAFCLGQHPNGYSQCITMYWDELPGKGGWTHMTTDSSFDVLDNLFVKFLKEHPRARMGYLLLTDRILFRNKTSFDGWEPSSPYILADTLDEAEGNWCANFLSPGEKRTLRLVQGVAIRPKTRYHLRYRVKTQELDGLGAFAAVYGSSGNLTEVGRRIVGTTDWTEESISFSSTSADSACNIYLKTEESKGLAFFDDVVLTEDREETSLLRNGGFEWSVPAFLYDNPRRHWSDAHGPERLSVHAPAEYIDFLQRIEKNTMTYGWEDRVRLGCHGYHHTPSLTEPEPSHEFCRYDPYGDSLKFHRIFTETASIGLTKASLRFFRPPGFRFSKSLIDLLVDNDFAFFDAAPLIGEYQAKFVQRNGKRMWTVWGNWWGDVSAGRDCAIIDSVLSQGHLAQIGAHPEDFWSGGMNRYWEINHIFTMWERAFPNMGYVFPDDWADNANATYALSVSSVDVGDRTLVCKLRGAVRKGTSAVFRGVCRRALLDGIPVQMSVHDSLTYLIFPDAKGKQHTVTLEDINSGGTPGATAPPAPLRETSGIRLLDNAVLVTTSSPLPLVVRVYTVAGRLVSAVEMQVAPGRHSVTYGKLARGTYLVKARVGSTRASKLVSILR